MREIFTAVGDRNISDYEVDHIFPASRDQEIKEAAGEDIDIHRIGNFQLLHHRVNNSEKGTQWPKGWLDDVSEGEKRRYHENNLYPDDIEMTPENFSEFTEEREKLIKQSLINRYVSSTTEG